MLISELAEKTEVSPKTIRYYESIDVLPAPERLDNGYRDYDRDDVERLRLVAGARRLDFSLDDIQEILAMRDEGEAPCRFVLDLMEEKVDEIDRRLRELKRLQGQLRDLHDLGLTFPMDDVQGKNCVCHLVSQQS